MRGLRVSLVTVILALAIVAGVLVAVITPVTLRLDLTHDIARVLHAHKGDTDAAAVGVAGRVAAARAAASGRHTAVVVVGVVLGPLLRVAEVAVVVVLLRAVVALRGALPLTAVTLAIIGVATALAAAVAATLAATAASAWVRRATAPAGDIAGLAAIKIEAIVSST